MKEILFLILLPLLFQSAYTADPTAEERRYNMLKFGSTEGDYILFQPDMSPFETEFTICAWIRKLKSDDLPTWFSYAVSDQKYEIQVTDMGYRTRIFGYESDLSSHYTVTPGKWFHNCMNWDAATQTRGIYIDGKLVDSKSTPAGRTLKQGGSVLLGNEQERGPGTGMDSANIFAGEMYKLNVFSKTLNDSEIKEMAKERCSEVEELYGETRSLKWEEVLLKSKTGTVTEEESGCEVYHKLQQTERRLNSTITALNQTQTELEQVKESLEKAAECPLNSTVTSYWDLLYSDDFFGEIFSAEKFEVLRKSIEKLGNLDFMI